MKSFDELRLDALENRTLELPQHVELSAEQLERSSTPMRGRTHYGRICKPSSALLTWRRSCLGENPTLQTVTKAALCAYVH